MRYYFAPMEGVTGAVYRRTHHEYFPGIDKYFMPFITPTTTERFTPRQKRDIAPEANAGVPAVPQLLTKSAADCIWAANALADMGYAEVNLNLGCPSGTVTAKGKGAGFLADPDALDRFLDAVFSATHARISIKTRLGMHAPTEFARLLEIYNRYPGLPAVMIGRGLIGDPSLVTRLRGGPRAERETLRAFHDALYARYCEAFGDARIAMLRMKEIWFYHLNLFEDSEKHGKQLKKATTPAVYEQAAAAVFRDLAVRDDIVPGWFRPA